MSVEQPQIWGYQIEIILFPSIGNFSPAVDCEIQSFVEK